mgnify:CR=1 FL=1|jgi:hypothetical protein
MNSAILHTGYLPGRKGKKPDSSKKHAFQYCHGPTAKFRVFLCLLDHDTSCPPISPL